MTSQGICIRKDGARIIHQNVALDKGSKRVGGGDVTCHRDNSNSSSVKSHVQFEMSPAKMLVSSRKKRSTGSVSATPGGMAGAVAGTSAADRTCRGSNSVYDISCLIEVCSWEMHVGYEMLSADASGGPHSIELWRAEPVCPSAPSGATIGGGGIGEKDMAG